MNKIGLPTALWTKQNRHQVILDRSIVQLALGLMDKLHERRRDELRRGFRAIEASAREFGPIKRARRRKILPNDIQSALTFILVPDVDCVIDSFSFEGKSEFPSQYTGLRLVVRDDRMVASPLIIDHRYLTIVGYQRLAHICVCGDIFAAGGGITAQQGCDHFAGSRGVYFGAGGHLVGNQPFKISIADVCVRPIDRSKYHFMINFFTGGLAADNARLKIINNFNIRHDL